MKAAVAKNPNMKVGLLPPPPPQTSERPKTGKVNQTLHLTIQENCKETFWFAQPEERHGCVYVDLHTVHHQREYNDRLWAREKSVKAEKRDRNAEREKETFRRQCHHQSSLHFFLALTIGHYILFENACELQRVVFHLEELYTTHQDSMRVVRIHHSVREYATQSVILWIELGLV